VAAPSTDHHAELVRRLYEARGSGRTDDALALVAEEVVWHIPGGDEQAAEVRGKGALREYWGRVEAAEADVAFSIHDVLANGEHAVALTEVTMNRAGATLVTRQIGLFHFADGEISEAWFYDEDPAAVHAFWS
jgi:ketosteroid isomerase-like protein